MHEIAYPLLLTTLAGACTLVGGLVFMLVKKVRAPHLSFFMGLSAGAILYVSLVELLPLSIETVGFGWANACFFGGMAVTALIDFLLPHDYMGEQVGDRRNRKLLSVGVLTAIGIGIHNFPEGMAVFWGTLGDSEIGLMVALATAIHNIPEGIAVALPIFAATKDRLKSLKFTFLAGAAEPVGALIAFALLGPFITDSLMGYVFGAIAGVMVFVSFDELLPCCFENRRGHTAIAGITVGMMVMALSLNFLI
jgi:ZIP family zinc transporter